jgi:hypothetical protein
MSRATQIAHNYQFGNKTSIFNELEQPVTRQLNFSLIDKKTHVILNINFHKSSSVITWFRGMGDDSEQVPVHILHICAHKLLKKHQVLGS